MITFRPHHFLCTLGFAGKGYSPQFIRNFSRIAQQLRSKEGDSVKLQVVHKTDSICSACPLQQGALCKHQTRIEQLDAAHQQALGLKNGQVLTWGQAKQRIGQRVTLQRFERMCASCSWKPLGLCRNALKQLLSTTNSDGFRNDDSCEQPPKQKTS
ncbi:MAG: DUF1284 domain-containing protein [Myxococcota bacterium]